MHSAYQKAFVLGPHRVMGFNLLPFSIGHAYLLDVLDCPWERPGEMTLADLAIAVRICAKDWAGGRRLIFRGGKGRWGLRALPSLLRGWPREALKFAEYVNECCEVPGRWEQSSGGSFENKLRMPWQLGIFRRLSAALPPSCWAEIWDLPICTAFVVDAAANVTDSSLMSEEEEAVIEQLEMMDAAS